MMDKLMRRRKSRAEARPLQGMATESRLQESWGEISPRKNRSERGRFRFARNDGIWAKVPRLRRSTLSFFLAQS